MSDYSPKQLGEIDEVQLVSLRGRDVDRVSEYMRLPDLEYRSLTGAEAQEVAKLWRELPKAEQMRCHVPLFGFRLLQSGEFVVEASLCWQCNNAFGYQGERKIWFEFEGTSSPAQALLSICKSQFP